MAKNHVSYQSHHDAFTWGAFIRNQCTVSIDRIAIGYWSNCEWYSNGAVTVADAADVGLHAIVRAANDANDCDRVHDANDVAFDGDDKCFYDYSNYLMCETLYDRDYKRHCLMAEDAVVPCDVSMLIWCLGVCRIHRIDGKQLMAMEAISVRCRHYFLIKHHHHYYNWRLMMDWRRRHLNWLINLKGKVRDKSDLCFYVFCFFVGLFMFLCVCFFFIIWYLHFFCTDKIVICFKRTIFFLNFWLINAGCELFLWGVVSRFQILVAV